MGSSVASRTPTVREGTLTQPLANARGSAWELKPGAHRSNSGDWIFTWNCDTCRDSGLVKTLLGPNQCTACQAFLNPTSARVFGAICVLTIKDKPVDDSLFNFARALVPATSENPLLGEALKSLLVLPSREVKRTAKRLRDEWHLPVIASREKPKGYFFATNAEEFLAWMRTTRSQAISELATAYQLFRDNFPELAGQQPLDFVDTVSTELQEAIR